MEKRIRNIKSVFCDNEVDKNPIFTTDNPSKIPNLISPVSASDPRTELLSFENGYYVPNEEVRQRIFERMQEAQISIAKEGVKTLIQEESHSRRLDREYNKKYAYLDYKKNWSDSPFEMYRTSDLRIGAFRVVSGVRKPGPLVIKTPELYFTKILPIEPEPAPEIIRITWRGCFIPRYLVGKNIDPSHMVQALNPYVEVRSSRRNRKEICNALFNFLRREAEFRVEKLHRHKGFVPDGHGDFVFVSGTNELTIEEVLKRG